MKKISKKNCSTYIDNPFTVFEIKDFLPKDIFEELLKTYPKENEFNKSISGYNKRTLNDEDFRFDEFVNRNVVWKKFFEDLKKQDFINSAYFFSLNANIKSRGLRALKKWKIGQVKILKKIFREVKWSFHFAIQNSDEKVLPHTDARGKLLSMIYYLSDKDKGQDNAGTEFWEIKKNKHKWINWNNKHIKDNIELREFKNDCEIFHKSKFEPNKLVGFVKSDISWHSVINVGVNNQGLRKTLNLFIKT